MSVHLSHIRFVVKTIAVLAALSLSQSTLRAQPPGRAEVDPQPVERIRKPKPARKPAGKAQRPVKQDKLVQNFEATFGRALTPEQQAKLQQATEEREAAIRAAQQEWRKQFLAVTGVTEAELKQKQREMRQKNLNGDAVRPGAAKPEAPVAAERKPAN